jgi:hypothetical protein
MGGDCFWMGVGIMIVSLSIWVYYDEWKHHKKIDKEWREWNDFLDDLYRRRK